MRTLSTNMTVQDFLAALERNEIRVNRDYQRSDEVWPEAARSYLIETVLLDFPIPKIALHQITDVLSGNSHKELVDGQQRCAALRAFRDDQFRLSKVVENESLRGLKYSNLDVDQRTRFLNYQLNIDLFLGAEAREIREVFRRMNSYTVPLNPEEQRHAMYQGVFKWFLHRVGLSLDSAWSEIGVFGEKAMVRMADTKLLAELCHALLYGVKTTNKRMLDKIYRDLDPQFEREREIEGRIRAAVELVRGWSELHNTAIAKHFQMYSLLLAVMHVTEPVPAFQEIHRVDRGGPIDREGAVERLSRLARAIDEEVTSGRYARFVEASSKGTNVKAKRETRFTVFCQALQG